MNPEQFEAYVTTRYLLGARGRELLFGLPQRWQGSQALVDALMSSDRSIRARALRAPLQRLTAALATRTPFR